MNLRLFGIAIAAAGLLLGIVMVAGALNVAAQSAAMFPNALDLVTGCFNPGYSNWLSANCPAGTNYPLLVYAGIGLLVIGGIIAFTARSSER